MKWKCIVGHHDASVADHQIFETVHEDVKDNCERDKNDSALCVEVWVLRSPLSGSFHVLIATCILRYAEKF